MIHRTQHWTDVPITGNVRRRVMRNWINYEPADGLWAPSVVGNVRVTGQLGVVAADACARASVQAPLKIYAEDVTSPDDTARVVLSYGDHWLAYRALDTVKGVKAMHGEASIVWPGLWPEASLEYSFGAARLDKKIHLDRPGHPVVFRFAL